MRLRTIAEAFAVAAIGVTILLIAGPPKEPFVPIVFTERAKQAGIDFVLKNHATPEKRQIEAMPAGVAVIDYNNDGWAARRGSADEAANCRCGQHREKRAKNVPF